MTVFTTSRTSSTCTLLSLLILLAANTALGQTAARPDRGVMKGASYSVSDIENIGLTNGNVNLSIPLASLPLIAGGKLGFFGGCSAVV